MKIRTRYLLAAVLAAAPVTAIAQTTAPPAQQDRHEHEGRRGEMRGRRGPGGPGRSPVQGLLRVAWRLNLTEVQRDSIEKLTERDRARADSVFRETRRGMRARFDSTMQAVEAVLTPQQRAEWQKIRQEWEERDRGEGRGRRGRGGPGRGPAGSHGPPAGDGEGEPGGP